MDVNVMEPRSFLLDPRPTLRFLNEPPPRGLVDLLLGELPLDALDEWLGRLEVSVSIVAVFEAIAELQIGKMADLLARAEEVFGAASRRAHRNVLELVTPHREYFSRGMKTLPDVPVNLTPDLLARIITPTLALCPITHLENVAKMGNRADAGHRCRIAYEWLEAFARRVDPMRDASRDIIAVAFAEGRLSLPEVADVMGSSTTDAIAWLEAHGHCRPIERFRLTDDQRQTIAAQMRQDRLARRGAPIDDRRLANRDVAATQRIEGIDARPWLPPDAD